MTLTNYKILKSFPAKDITKIKEKEAVKMALPFLHASLASYFPRSVFKTDLMYYTCTIKTP